MKTGRNIAVALSLYAALSLCRLAHCEDAPFKGEVSSDGINLRVDSTVNSETICKADKATCLDIIEEKYGWYKIRLPKHAPSFIRSDFLLIIDKNTAKVSKSKVNIRLRAAEDSPILGRVDKDTLVTIISEDKGWYRIEAPGSSFGWVNKQFIKVPCTNAKSATAKPVEINPAEKIPSKGEKIMPKENKDIFVTKGIVRPYGRIFNRAATHKLITEDNTVYLLKGEKNMLNSLTYHTVKITGKISVLPKEKFPIIEIEKIEVLD